MNIQRILKAEKALRWEIEQFKPYLADKSRPLDERWDEFSKIFMFLPTDPYSDGDCEKLLHQTAYDAGIEKYQTMSYPALYERYLDRVYEKEQLGDDEDEYLRNLPLQEVADEWREEVLAAGRGSFTNDW